MERSRALRQDPDVILVGEMRDRETVEIGLSAAEKITSSESLSRTTRLSSSSLPLPMKYRASGLRRDFSLTAHPP